MSTTRRIGIVLFPGVEELDFVGPWEIFTMTGSANPGVEPRCVVFTVSQTGGEVVCAKGLRVLADYDFGNAPLADLIVVPGGRGTRSEVDNPRMIDYLRQAARTAEVVSSVCTGAFLLERAGLLHGRRATTHWASLDRLRAFADIEVVDDQRWVDEGPIVTSQGVSAGIDMALYLVGRFWGVDAARGVQKMVEYFPDPPYANVPTPVTA
ncbi:MAG TPA: DJ-1/PfpI family protein [Chloroflexota bacterium]|nr:DJ-1/PfpI family protein [Chloroflexota bacterium]